MQFDEHLCDIQHVLTDTARRAVRQRQLSFLLFLFSVSCRKWFFSELVVFLSKPRLIAGTPSVFFICLVLHPKRTFVNRQMDCPSLSSNQYQIIDYNCENYNGVRDEKRQKHCFCCFSSCVSLWFHFPSTSQPVVRSSVPAQIDADQRPSTQR